MNVSIYWWKDKRGQICVRKEGSEGFEGQDKLTPDIRMH